MATTTGMPALQGSGFTAPVHYENKPFINQDKVTVVPPGTTVVVPGAAAVDVVKGSRDSVNGFTTVATAPSISSPYSSLTGYDSAYFNQDDLTFNSHQSKPSNEGGALAVSVAPSNLDKLTWTLYLYSVSSHATNIGWYRACQASRHRT